MPSKTKKKERELKQYPDNKQEKSVWKYNFRVPMRAVLLLLMMMILSSASCIILRVPHFYTFARDSKFNFECMRIVIMIIIVHT